MVACFVLSLESANSSCLQMLCSYIKGKIGLFKSRFTVYRGEQREPQSGGAARIGQKLMSSENQPGLQPETDTFADSKSGPSV